MVDGWLVGRSVIRGVKNMFGVVILPEEFGRSLFCSFIFIFFYIDGKEKINLIARSSHSNL